LIHLLIKKAKVPENPKVAKALNKKKVESDDEEIEVVKNVPVANGKKKVPAKKEESSDESEEEKKPVAKKAPVKVPAKKQESSDESEEEKKPVAKKAPVKVPAKKQESSDESEVEAPKKPVTKAVPTKTAPKKVESDEEESSEEVKKPVAKTAPKKKEESEEEDDEEEVPMKTVPQKKEEPKKQTNTSGSTCTELFVRNLAWATDENSLEKFFSNYGTVLSKKVLTDRNTGKPRGIGFVEFSTREEAQAALDDADNLNLDGRLIQCTFSDEKPERTGGAPNKGGYQAGNGRSNQRSNYQGEKHTAFVGNLSFKATEQSVEKFFQSCGNVVGVRIAKNEEGKNKGFCHVDFDSAEALQGALKMAGQQLDGREVRVDASLPREGGQRGGFGGGRGRGGFGGGRGGRPQFNPMDRAKKSGALSVANSNAVKTFDDDDE